mgnify:FL=1
MSIKSTLFKLGAISAVLLTFSPDAGISALEDVITIVGLPFFVMGYLMIWALNRAMKEDAGELLPLATRRYRKVLPPEEVERRRAEGDEAWSDTALEQDPHYMDSEGHVIAAPEAAAYEQHELYEAGEDRPSEEVTGSSRLNGTA